MEMVEKESRSSRKSRLHPGNVLLKFQMEHCLPDATGVSGKGSDDEILGDDDSTPGDGCLVSCFPNCQKPVYRAGQMVSGFLLVRPVIRVVICGVAVRFGGRSHTDWKEHNIRWMTSRVFFAEKHHIIENRLITLDSKWHRFDFEYRLPFELPSSIKQNEGKVRYHACAIIAQPNGPDLESHEVSFYVDARLDVDLLPVWLRIPVERKVELFRPEVENRRTCRVQSHNESTSEIAYDSSESKFQQNDDYLHSMDSLVSASFCLNRRVFVAGEQIGVDSTIVNKTHVSLLCSVKLQQVSAFFADYGLEKRGRHLPLYQHYKRNIKTIVKDLVVSSSLIIPPNKTKSFSCSLHIPKLPPSTCDSHLICVSSCSNRLHEGQFLLDIDDHLIKLKYFCRLVVIPQWTRPERLIIPIEVRIGTHSSRAAAATNTTSSRRSSRSNQGCSSLATLDSSTADLIEADVDLEPFDYEDYFLRESKLVSSTC